MLIWRFDRFMLALIACTTSHGNTVLQHALTRPTNFSILSDSMMESQKHLKEATDMARPAAGLVCDRPSSLDTAWNLACVILHLYTNVLCCGMIKQLACQQPFHPNMAGVYVKATPPAWINAFDCICEYHSQSTPGCKTD